MTRDLRAIRARIGRLHVITDETLQSRFSHGEVARLAVQGGADTVQYREKRPLSTREMVAAVRMVADACRDGGATCIVDDRADVAMAANAGGVHVGRNDLEAAVARRLLGDLFVIGGTANSLEEARSIFRGSLDYIGVGPIFGTNSKANPASVMGLATLQQIVAESPIPIIAIGNITPNRVEDVLATGAFGIAVLSGVTCTPDPAVAAADYQERIVAYLRREGTLP